MASNAITTKWREAIPSVKLYIDTKQPLRARELARLLITTARAFEDYALNYADQRQPATLVVADLRTGSVFAELVAVLKHIKDFADLAEAATTVYDARGLIAGFATHLSDILGVIAQGRSLQQTASPGARAFAKASSQIINSGTHNGITVNVTGSNNTVIIDAEGARALIEGERRMRAEEQAGASERRSWEMVSPAYRIGGVAAAPFLLRGTDRSPVAVADPYQPLPLARNPPEFTVGRDTVLRTAYCHRENGVWRAYDPNNHDEIPVLDPAGQLPSEGDDASAAGHLLNIAGRTVAFEVVSLQR